MRELFEAVMMVCFGISWPLAIIKSYTGRTARGKSLPFLLFIITGYAFGIASKIAGQHITYVLYFYILNLLMVSTDLLLYFRNRRLDRLKEGAA